MGRHKLGSGRVTVADPFSLLPGAATGDLLAQRQLAEIAVALVAEGDENPLPTLREGLVFARLAAINGNEGDTGRLISMLSLAAAYSEEADDQDQYLGEAIARISLAAEAGVAVAEVNLGSVVDSVSPVAAAMAKDFERRLRVGV